MQLFNVKKVGKLKQRTALYIIVSTYQIFCYFVEVIFSCYFWSDVMKKNL